MTDEFISDHPYTGELRAGASCQYQYPGAIVGINSEMSGYVEAPGTICGRQAMEHANPGSNRERHLIHTHPHGFVPQAQAPGLCAFQPNMLGMYRSEIPVCGYPEQLHHWAAYDAHMTTTAGKVGVGEPNTGIPAAALADSLRGKEEVGVGVGPKWNEEYQKRTGDIVRQADAAQYEREPMPDAARRGPVVTLIDAPVDPLGTLAVIGGIYTGKVRRSKAEVTDEERRGMLADMQATVLDGPLEAIQFTFLVEGVSRAFTHQAVRNRFSFFAQESLRFAVAEDWAQEVPLPPALSSAGDDEPAVGIWRKAMNAAEDAYAALVGAGMPAEEARGVLPHAITTRYYWTVSLRTLLQEAGKRTCTQAQFDWRIVMAGVAKALRERESQTYFKPSPYERLGTAMSRIPGDRWQYEALADLIRPVCYQQGKCGFMAKFDRGCTIRGRVDAFAAAGVPSSEWGNPDVKHYGPDGVELAWIDPREWAADPAAARVVGDGGDGRPA